MDMKKMVCFVAFILVHFPSLEVVCSDNNDEKNSGGNLIHFQEINEDVVEYIWAKCRLELSHLKQSVVDVDVKDTENRISAKERILKYLSSHDPHTEDTLLDCIREKSRSLHSPFSGRIPSHSRVSTTLAISKTDSSPDSANLTSEKKDDNTTAIIIAVVVTAVVTLFIVALAFVCYSRICGSGRVINDEKPLLSFTLSDYSSGGSQRPYASENSVDKGKLGHQSFSDSLSLDASLYLESESSKYGNPLESTSGRLSSSGLPPLKPPPGRIMEPPLPPPPGKVDTSLVPPPANSIPLPPPGPPPPPPPPPQPRPPPSALRPSGGPPPPPPAGPPPPPPPVPFGMKTGGPRPPPPPGGPRPPPPPGGGIPPPRVPSIGFKPPRSNAPPPPNRPLDESDSSKAKLKPFFWDKVAANSGQSMVWHQIKSGSFQFNEEMIETLFGYTATENNKKQPKISLSQDPPTQYIQIIDRKKAQNLSILLKALNVTTEEVCGALQEGNELPPELVHTLIKMAPSAEEELKLRLYDGEISRLGNAERFLKFLVEIPFAFKRLESLLFMCTLQEEESMIKEAFTTLEAACTELRKSRLFLKLLEAVLKTGNRMNVGTFRGSAQAFKLDTLLKLSDVKGADGKTTLLHFVVQEIIRSEGIRAARAARDNRSFSSIKTEDLLEDISDDLEEHYRNLGLQVVSRLGSELENVKKAAILDADNVIGTVAKLNHALVKSRDFLNSEMKNLEEDNGFHESLKNFVQNTEGDITGLRAEEKRIMALVKSTADYFHGNAGKDEGLRLFVIVRDFLIILDKACKEVKNDPRKPSNKPPPKKEDQSKPSNSPGPQQSPSADPRQRLFPAIAERRVNNSSSDEESP